MVAVRPTKFTEREYLALEGVAEVKHEFIDGEIVAMAGAEYAHNLVCQNTRLALGIALSERPCAVLGADQRVRVDATRDYCYPDVVVTCLDPELAEPKPSALLNPQVIFEVLSPSTEAYDRGPKWIAYQQIPTLTDYVLVSADRVKVQHYQRTAEGWLLRDLEEEELRLSSDVSLDVRRFYRLVDLDRG